jgi:hypothetical protein
MRKWKSPRWALSLLVLRMYIFLIVPLSLLLRQNLIDLRNDRLLIVTVITSFCADYRPSLFFMLSTVANIWRFDIYSGGVDWGDCRTVPDSETVHRSHIATNSGESSLARFLKHTYWSAPYHRQMQQNTSHPCGWRWRARWSWRLEFASAALSFVSPLILRFMSS